jgi:hypothetical protein
MEPIQALSSRLASAPICPRLASPLQRIDRRGTGGAPNAPSDRSHSSVFALSDNLGETMTDLPREPLAPISFAGGRLDHYRHICAFINSREEGNRLLDPFVVEGLEQGEKALYLVDAAERATLVSHLRHLGLDMPGLLERRQCEVRTWSETYLRGGRFDQDAMLGLLDEFLVSSQSPRIRMVADMGWAVDQPDVRDLLIEFEARANFVHAHHDHVVICVYDTAKFDGDFIVDILRTHPMALIGGVLQINPFFVPAAEFLEELRSHDVPSPRD